MKTLYFAIIAVFSLVFGLSGVVLASDSEVYESSTASTYYDYMLSQKQKQAEKMEDFKGKIGGTVSDLKSDVEAPSSAVKSATKEQAASTATQDSAVLGSLYGTKGKLGIEKKSDKGEPSILGGITGVSDTQVLNPKISNEMNLRVPAPVVTSPVVAPNILPTQPNPPINCRTVCTQSGYGRVCNEVCY